MSDDLNQDDEVQDDSLKDETVQNVPTEGEAVSGMYENWFLDYASYVILERAVPAMEDGLKPVQRRILHSMKDMDDGRYNKVANIIGHTMQYHPHGDAAIGDAMVNLGQKDLLIDTQGNWGDIRTGDRAAAPRYIEARLTKFALAVAFNAQTTTWQKSYDGRNKEPVTLPFKFPLLLAQGVEGIAVGLSTKVLPHNFQELIKQSIRILEGKKPEIYPDFQTGGMVDISDYQDGRRGGRVKVRARIEERDKRTLSIQDIPYGTTTSSIIDSILKANDKGKIKIKKVIDNTAQEVDVEIQLPANVSIDKTIDALYAFTQCEVSISPNACVIFDNKPQFVGVTDILQICTEQTKELLGTELRIKLGELQEKWHFSSLEKIFIEERIYRDIEECETWEEIIDTIDKGLDPFKKLLRRDITKDDIARLTEIKIKRISKFDKFKADELLRSIEEELEKVQDHLDNLTEYTINYYSDLLEKFGKGRERRTEIRSFEEINTKIVAVANEKLYVNYKEGFVGTGLKKDEYVCDCSDIDDIIVFRKDGKYSVSTVNSKAFFGKNIIHVAVFRKHDDRMVYNAIYIDGKTRISYAKRFNVKSVTRDKEYDLTTGAPGSKVLYFSANPNGEAEIVNVQLISQARARNLLFAYDFSELAIKGKNSKGNIVSKHPVRRVDLKEKGKSTIGGRDIYYEKEIGRLNVDGRGVLLGSFQTDDKILVIYNSGEYELTNHELTNHYDYKNIDIIEKFDENTVISCVHYEHDQKRYLVKRFLVETTTLDKRFLFINDGSRDKLVLVTTWESPVVEITTKDKKNEVAKEEVNLKDFIDIKGWKSLGNLLTKDKLTKAKLLRDDAPKKEVKATDNGNDNHSGSDEKEKDTAEKPSPDDKSIKTSSKPPGKGRPDDETHTSGDQITLL